MNKSKSLKNEPDSDYEQKNDNEVSSPAQLTPPFIDIVFTDENSEVENNDNNTRPVPLIKSVNVGASIWQKNKRVIGLYSTTKDRNSWVNIDGIGWKKLKNNSNSAIVALTMICSHAFEKGSSIDYREESDGMIYEIYAW